MARPMVVWSMVLFLVATASEIAGTKATANEEVTIEGKSNSGSAIPLNFP